MRRVLAIGAVSALIFAVFALVAGQSLTRVSAQSSSSGNLYLVFPANPPVGAGCPLGPSFTFCDQTPGASNQAFFVLNTHATVNGVSATLGSIPGLSANFAAGDFTMTQNTCTGTIVPNQGCQIEITFSPTTTGLRQAAVTVTDSSGDTLVINIAGTGSQLVLGSFSQLPAGCTHVPLPDNAYTFCDEPVGGVSPVETFTVTAGNSGAYGVNVSMVPTSGLESEFAVGDFTIESTTCTGTLAPNGSCTLGVAFTPKTAGMRSATLVASDSSGDTTRFYLAGATSNGISVTVSGSNPSSCQSINFFGFCNAPVGGVTTNSTLHILNTSGTQITGLSVPTGSVIAQGATAPDFTVQSNSCSSVLDAGASCNITVAFTPTTTGLRQGAIVVTDAQGDVATVNLAGVGDDYSIVPQLPTEVSVIPGGTATFDATLTPDNVLGMNGEQVTFTCPTNLPTNASCAVTPCPATITPGTLVSVQMVLVTSSTKTVAPKPTGGCSSYGPSQAALIAAPRGDRGDPPSAAPGASRSSPLYPALLVFAAFGAIGLLMAGFAAPGSATWRKRVPLMLACAGLAAAILAGCRHHTPTNTTATPTGVTNLIAHGEALDASDNSLNASRQFQVTLDVVTK